MRKFYFMPVASVLLTACVGSTSDTATNTDTTALSEAASETYPAVTSVSSSSRDTALSSAGQSSRSVTSSSAASSELIDLPSVSSSSQSSSTSSSTPPALLGKNLLGSDGTFTQGQQGFSSFFDASILPSTATFDNEAAFNLGSASTMISHAQLQHAVQVIENTQYTVCLDVVAEADRSFEFSIDGDEDSSFITLNALAIGAEPGAVISTATTQLQTLKYTFYASTTDNTARFILSLANSDANIRFDNIGLYEGEACADPARPVITTGIDPDTTSALTDINYEAPRTTATPFNGVYLPESEWEKAPWAAIDKAWLFDDLIAPESADDFTGRYRALWDENTLYVFVEVTDDSRRIDNSDLLTSYEQNDSVVIFLDEDRSGGLHNNNGQAPGINDANAFAYHLSIQEDVIDIFNGQPTFLNESHAKVAFAVPPENPSPFKSFWQIAITVWGDDYTLDGEHIPVTLTEGKVMGFTVAAIDQDFVVADQVISDRRQHVIGSVNTPLHQSGEGVNNADAFGSIKLVPAASNE